MNLSQFQVSDEPGNCEGFDRYAGRKWIYPNNLPVRGYQKNAVQKSLFTNTMVVLPTGMGKTFIAAVVMYNFYRWYPSGKLIFVAPTRPLVRQQIGECKKITGIPSSDCIELTGHTPSTTRRQFWHSKRVFFATPQVIENDLEQNILPATSIKCLVIDEAHRAQGNYAYVNIVKHLQSSNKDGFRVMALTATPASTLEKIHQVMMNLLISEVIYRSETSIDLLQFKNEKTSKAWTLKLPPHHQSIVDRFIKISDPIYKELYRAGLTFSFDSIDKVPKYCLIKASNQVSNNEAGARGGGLKWKCFTAVSLSHQFELLTLYGLRVFYASIQRAFEDNKSAIKTALAGSVEFDKIMTEIKMMFQDYVEPDASKKVIGSEIDLIKGHPKLFSVKDLLMKHFEECSRQEKETRAIVFTKYRDSVFDIVQTLRSYEPILKPTAFIGQGSGNKRSSAGGITQKEQLKLIQDFKAGLYNVLVATCVAEEGLDIGEVDIIICYDTTASPISNVQRRGRTGRKRCGNVHTLVTGQFEEKRLKKAGNSRRQVEDSLFKRENYMSFRYHKAPRMIPLDCELPTCLEHHLKPVEEDEEEEEERSKKRRTKRRKKDGEDEGTVKNKAKEDKLDKFVDKTEKKLVEDWDDSFDSYEGDKEATTPTVAAVDLTEEEEEEDEVKVVDKVDPVELGKWNMAEMWDSWDEEGDDD